MGIRGSSCLSVQETGIQSLIQEDHVEQISPHSAPNDPVLQNLGATATEALGPVPCNRSHQSEKPGHRN